MHSFSRARIGFSSVLFFILLLGAVATSAAKSISPLYYSGDEQSDEAQWNRLLKYKLWATGAGGITIYGGAHVTDTTGSVGSAHGGLTYENMAHALGGPLIFAGPMIVYDGNDTIVSGPSRFDGGFEFYGGRETNWRGNHGNVFKGKFCVPNSSATPNVGENRTCDGVPTVDADLNIPEFSTTESLYDVVTSNITSIGKRDGKNLYIDIPEGDKEDTYDILIKGDVNLKSNIENIYVRLPYAGRMTRFFITDDLILNNNSNIQVIYAGETEQWHDGWAKDYRDTATIRDSTGKIREYAGDLLFYVGKNFTVESGKKVVHGTYIFKKVKIWQDMRFAGQLLASDEISIDAYFKSEFRYMPFGGPKIDTKAIVSGELVEGETNQVVDFRLTDTAIVAVSFKYCYSFDPKADESTVRNDKAGVETPAHRNDIADKNIPLCSEGKSKIVSFEPGKQYPKTKETLTAFDDEIVENREYFYVRIFDVTGAALNNGLTSDSVRIYINDNDNGIPVSHDVTIYASTSKDTIGYEDKPFLITSFPAFVEDKDGKEGKALSEYKVKFITVPAKGTLGYHGGPVKAGDIITSADIQKGQLQFVSDPDDYADSAKGYLYTDFKFLILNKNDSAAKKSNTMSIEMKPLNDKPQIVYIGTKYEGKYSLDNNVFNFKENAPVDSVIGLVVATDVDMVLDPKATLSYSIIKAPTESGYNDVYGSGNFKINSKTGEISVAKALNYNDGAKYMGRVVVTDNGVPDNRKDVLKDTVDFYITLVEIPKPPHIKAKDTVAYVNEHSPLNTVVMEFKATDENKGDKLNLEFKLESVTGGAVPFAIQNVPKSDSAYVYVKSDIDFETMNTKYRYRIVVSDDTSKAKALYDTTYLTIYIRDVNEYPVVADQFAFQISDGSIYPDSVGKVEASDLDIKAPPATVLKYVMGTVYDVTDPSNKTVASGMFAIDGATGKVYVSQKTALSSQLQNHEFEAEVTVTDNGSEQRFCVDSIYVIGVDINGKQITKVDTACHDSKNLTSRTTVTIKIPDHNYPPKMDSTSYTFKVKENSPAATFVGKVRATDRNGDQLVFTLSDATLPFEIVNGENSATIQVKKNVVIDYETTKRYTFKVYVSDGGRNDDNPSLESKDSANITVDVLDENEKPSIDNYEFSVKEHTKKGTTVGKVKVVDVDTWTKISYALEDSTKDAAGKFKITSATTCDVGFYCGEITVNTDSLNFEVEQLYIIKVIATDNGKEYGLPPSMSDMAIVKIHVIDENDTPKFDIKDYKFAVDENTPLYTFVGEVHASDEDVGDTVTYSVIEITSGVSEIFNVDKHTGRILIAKDVLDYEKLAEYKFKVVATDNGNPVLKDTALVTISINNVNERPILNKSQTLTVKEWTPIGDVIGTVTAGDLDTNASFMKHKFFAVGGDTLLFSIDSMTGKVSVRDTIFDATDEIVSYMLDVRVVDYSDGPLLFDNGEIEIILDHANDPPRIAQATYYVFENSEEGDYVGDVNARDDKTPYEKLKFEIVGKSDEFEISVKYNGRITVKAGAELDYETQNKYVITIRVTDEEGAYSENDFTILVKNLNEPPALKNTEFHIAENSKAGTLVGRVTGWDPEDGDQVVFAWGDTTFVSDEFELASTGNIRVKKGAVLNYETTKVYTMPVMVSDKEGLFSVGEVTIFIDDVNEPPTLESKEFHIAENSPANTFVGQLVAHDVEDDDDELVFDLMGSSLEFEVSKNGKITVKKGAQLDYETKREYTLQIRVKDTGDSSSTNSVIIYIDDVREPPSLNDTTFHVTENVPKGTTVGKLVAKNPEKDSLTYKLITVSEKFKVREDGTVITIGEIDYEEQKTHKLKVVVVGKDGCVDTALVTIEVDNVIEKPKVKITRGDDGDTVWVKPDTIYTNKHKIDFEWTVNDKLRPDTLANFPKDSTYIFSLCYEDPTMDMPGCDTVIVKIDNSIPKVRISKSAEDTSAISGVTIVEQVDKKDTNFYVNHEDNVVHVAITDKAMDVDSTFDIDLRLDSLKGTKKALEEIKKIAKTELTLEDAENAQTKRTPINDSTFEVSFKRLIGDDTVTVVYYTDTKGKTIKNSDGDVIMKITYNTEIDEKPITVSYNVNGKTGEIVKNENGGVYEFSYSYVDKFGGVVRVRYAVDEKGKFAKTEVGDLGYQVSYTYKNRYGNSATKNISVVVDKIVPKVKIVSPENKLVVRISGVDVEWTVDGEVQDTLVIQSLKSGLNKVVRTYRDKAGNEASDMVEVYLKAPKELDVHVEKPVTIVSEDSVRKYYETNPPAKGQSYAVSMYNPYTDQEVETYIGGTFGNKKASKKEVYPGMDGHLGPTLLFDALAPRCGDKTAGGLCTLDDLIERDGKISLDAGGGWDRRKVTVEEYVKDHCSSEFRKSYKNDPSKASLYKTSLHVTIWIYTNLGGFLDEYSFTQEVNDPDFVNAVGEVNMAFEMKPDINGNVLASNGRLLGTGAYIFNTEVKSVSELRCKLPGEEIGHKRYATDALRKSFGYKRPDMNKKAKKSSSKKKSDKKK